MTRAALRAGFGLWASLLVLGVIPSEVVAIVDLFEAYEFCPASNRLRSLTGLTVYRTEQSDQILVTWDQPDPSRWKLADFTAMITVIVAGPEGSQAQFTWLGVPGVLFGDIDPDREWRVQVAVTDRDHVISDIAQQIFTPSALDQAPSPVVVRQTAESLIPVEEVHEAPFDNLAEHVQGHYRLHWKRSWVTATFSSVGSVVADTARSGTPLLTLPLGFRPATTLIREVSGWPVEKRTGMNPPSHLEADVLQPIRFHLQIEPNGVVRYIAGLELREGEQLAYMLTTTWPTISVMGPFANAIRHREGTYGLQRAGPEVAGYIRAARSPAPSTVNQSQEVLFTVPEGYRPMTETLIRIPWAHPVDNAGSYLTKRRQRQTLQIAVSPSGRVRYVQTGAVPAEHYLAYELAVGWETGDTSPAVPSTPTDGTDLCARHPVLQAAVLAALSQAEVEPLTCASVNPTDLARVETLELELAYLDAPLQRSDLADLLQLRHLSLRVPDVLFRWLPINLLAEQSRLQEFDLILYRKLRNYHLYNYNKTEEWLHVPTLALRLVDVEFHSPMWYPYYVKPYMLEEGLSVTRLAGFLSQVPNLSRLTLTGQVRSFNGSLLANNNQLRQLVLYSPTCLEVSVDLLAPVPHLQSLDLHCQLWALPNGFLDQTPELRILNIQFADAYKYNPYLLVQPLPSRLLAKVPHLQHLCLHGETLRTKALPPDLFHYTPHLKAIAVPESGGYITRADCPERESLMHSS